MKDIGFLKDLVLSSTQLANTMEFQKGFYSRYALPINKFYLGNYYPRTWNL